MGQIRIKTSQGWKKLDLGNADLFESLIYSQFKSKIDNSELTPGKYYRITDYATVATGENVSVSTDAYLPFDIIVLATTTSTFEENAYACARDGVAYSVTVSFDKWQLKYCLHSDRYEWLHDPETGEVIANKGVICYLKDEFNNEAPYDFKNILWKGMWTYTNVYTDEEGTEHTVDASLNSRYESKSSCTGNQIKPRIHMQYWMLNRINIIARDTYITNNLFEDDCHEISIQAKEMCEMFYNRFSSKLNNCCIYCEDTSGNSYSFDSCVFDYNLAGTTAIYSNETTASTAVTYISKVGEDVKCKTLSDIISHPEPIKVTYDELKTKIDNSTLVKGQSYRITDYTTVVNSSYTLATDATAFDIVVTANSANTIDENAKAVAKDNATYVWGQVPDFGAWQLKYDTGQRVVKEDETTHVKTYSQEFYDWINGSAEIFYPTSKGASAANALQTPTVDCTIRLSEYESGTELPIYKAATVGGTSYAYLYSSLETGKTLLTYGANFIQTIIDANLAQPIEWTNITVKSATTIEVTEGGTATYTRAPQYDCEGWYCYVGEDNYYFQYSTHSIEDYATITEDTSYYLANSASDVINALNTGCKEDVISKGSISEPVDHKGIVYYMKDEYDNEASYDFKNILISGNYTFTWMQTDSGGVTTMRDASLNLCKCASNQCLGNVIKPYIQANKYYINNIHFKVYWSDIVGNIFGTDCHDISLETNGTASINKNIFKDNANTINLWSNIDNVYFNNCTFDSVSSLSMGATTTTHNEYNKLISYDGTNTYVKEVKELLQDTGGGASIIEKTYSDLKTLKDGGNLVKGQLYRITDYVATTSQSNTHSASKQFDVIVLATSANTISEDAWAINHTFGEGETDPFASCNLKAWEIKYSFDNDTTRFTWADSTNGKGVIYYMKDEWNNEAPFDFKGIQIQNIKIDSCSQTVYLTTQYWVDKYVPTDSTVYGYTLGTDTALYYLFSNTADTDASLDGTCKNNVIKYKDTGIPMCRIEGSDNHTTGYSSYIVLLGNNNYITNSTNIFLANSKDTVTNSTYVTLGTTSSSSTETTNNITNGFRVLGDAWVCMQLSGSTSNIVIAAGQYSSLYNAMNIYSLISSASNFTYNTISNTNYVYIKSEKFIKNIVEACLGTSSSNYSLKFSNSTSTTYKVVVQSNVFTGIIKFAASCVTSDINITANTFTGISTFATNYSVTDSYFYKGSTIVPTASISSAYYVFGEKKF